MGYSKYFASRLSIDKVASSCLLALLRGLPLMIWGNGLEEKLKINLFFLWESLLWFYGYWDSGHIWNLWNATEGNGIKGLE